MPASPCWGLEPSTLVIAGAHHRAGSELLTRIMGALCKRCFNLKRWKTDYAPGARCAIDVNVGIHAHDDQFNSSSLIAAYSHGLRLISTGHWKLPLNELEAALRAAGVPWKMVHVVRQPIGLVLSAYYLTHGAVVAASAAACPPSMLESAASLRPKREYVDQDTGLSAPPM